MCEYITYNSTSKSHVISYSDLVAGRYIVPHLSLLPLPYLIYSSAMAPHASDGPVIAEFRQTECPGHPPSSITNVICCS